mgnify:CR=1 FL=1
MRWAGPALASTTVVVMVAATPAAADWGATRWGMTKDEVQAAIGGKAVDDGGGNLIVRAPQDVAGFQFDDVTYVFESGRLKRVTYSGRRVNFSALRSALTEQFGEPTELDTAARGHYLFMDAAKGNSIHAVDHRDNSVLLSFGQIENRF